MKRIFGDNVGQATVEFAIVGIIVVIFALVLANLWGRVSDGTFTAHLSASASHTGAGGLLGGIGDVVFF